MRVTLTFIAVVLACFITMTSAEAQSYFRCTQVRYFGPSCQPVATPQPAELAPQETPPELPRLTAENTPMFTPELMSPDAPPLVQQLMLDPTEANGLEMARWHLRRMIKIKQGEAAMSRAIANNPEELEPLKHELRETLRRALTAKGLKLGDAFKW